MPGLAADSGPGTRRGICYLASWHWIFLINIPIGVHWHLYARKYMPNFTTPRRRFDIGGFLLFGLVWCYFPAVLNCLGRNRGDIAGAGRDCRQSVTAAWPMRVTRVAIRRRLSRCLFKTHTFSVGIAGNLATRLGRLRTVSDAADACRLVSAIRPLSPLCRSPHRYRLDYCEIHRYPGAALVWLS